MALPDPSITEGYHITYDITNATREDLLDIVTMISPTETPFFTMCGRSKAAQTLHEWLTDELSAPATNKRFEGFDPVAGDFHSTERSRLQNYVQILANPYSVSDTLETVEKAGIPSEIAYQAAKKMKEHARDIEYAILNNTAAGHAGDAATNERQMKNATAFIDSSNTVNPDAGAGAAMVEKDINDVIELAWEDGGDVDTAFVNPTIKRKITGFMQVSPRTMHIDHPITAGPGTRRMINTVDIYESDFGTVRIVPDRWIPTNLGTGTDGTRMLVVDSSRWYYAMLSAPKNEALAKTGHGRKYWVISEGCVEGRAPKANGCLEDIQNSL